MPLTTEIIFHFHFHFKAFPEKEREREREHARERKQREREREQARERGRADDCDRDRDPVQQLHAGEEEPMTARERGRSEIAIGAVLREIAPSITISRRSRSRLREIAPSIVIRTHGNIFLFRKLAFPENMYFPENVLQQPNTALLGSPFSLSGNVKAPSSLICIRIWLIGAVGGVKLVNLLVGGLERLSSRQSSVLAIFHPLFCRASFCLSLFLDFSLWASSASSAFMYLVVL